jgi:hypothetical protein
MTRMDKIQKRNDPVEHAMTMKQGRQAGGWAGAWMGG